MFLVYIYFFSDLNGTLNKILPLDSLKNVASMLTNTLLMAVNDTSKLMDLLKSAEGLGLLEKLPFTFLSDALADLVSAALNGLIDLSGLMNFYPRPEAKSIFQCHENGSYELKVFNLTGIYCRSTRDI
jgi:hypothetical protein